MYVWWGGMVDAGGVACSGHGNGNGFGTSRGSGLDRPGKGAVWCVVGFDDNQGLDMSKEKVWLAEGDVGGWYETYKGKDKLVEGLGRDEGRRMDW